ncbi:hypothetical protein TVAG_516530 [Trichomonas vaginalis G3]|uniref:Uncharacterized protein n=1 Tax=Trichomonas vaginalis (strain ATCC PRA-98 / G3) TaxID=412133 RepID=A2H6K4_TRIV3|nr:MULE transposase domain-containing protein [Trichomonas vaginalis G3]EAX74963.1 hypothetical protein TVAG_516530 [Trichomonas vaginalis G3]KAI5543756.1 MULE transposase domain-containing protein [Trichomonas vaginalis G3]|eukprot:XP_001287893.1 hypothetical protein [Trichomonas vaginalis G3]
MEKTIRNSEEIKEERRLQCINTAQALLKVLEAGQIDPNNVYSALKVLLARHHYI